MTPPPECEIRICREPAFEQTACGLWLCPDHKREHEDEQRQGDGEFDELGRNKAVMRHARAM